jgi:hypothetical protein
MCGVSGSSQNLNSSASPSPPRMPDGISVFQLEYPAGHRPTLAEVLSDVSAIAYAEALVDPARFVSPLASELVPLCGRSQGGPMITSKVSESFEREWSELVDLLAAPKNLTRGSDGRDRVAYLAGKWLLETLAVYVSMNHELAKIAQGSKDHVDCVRQLYALALKTQEDLNNLKPQQVPE